MRPREPVSGSPEPFSRAMMAQGCMKTMDYAEWPEWQRENGSTASMSRFNAVGVAKRRIGGMYSCRGD